MFMEKCSKIDGKEKILKLCVAIDCQLEDLMNLFYNLSHKKTVCREHNIKIYIHI